MARVYGYEDNYVQYHKSWQMVCKWRGIVSRIAAPHYR